MEILIVHAHPEPKSFNTALKNCAVETATALGHTVTVSDLYAMQFNPLSTAADFKATANAEYFKPQAEQVNAYQQGLFSDELQNEMNKFDKADLVIFNFPLWWFSMPAILKGWVDRVFAMGFAYGAGKGVYENGAFKNKRAFVTTTTGGPENSYGDKGKNGKTETILFPIQHGIFYFVGMQVLEPFIAYAPARLTDEERKGILENYKKKIENAFTEAPLPWSMQ